MEPRRRRWVLPAVLVAAALLVGGAVLVAVLPPDVPERIWVRHAADLDARMADPASEFEPRAGLAPGEEGLGIRWELWFGCGFADVPSEVRSRPGRLARWAAALTGRPARELRYLGTGNTVTVNAGTWSEFLVDPLPEDAEVLRDLAAAWRHRVEGRREAGEIRLLAGGRVEGAATEARWSVEGARLVLRWASPAAPGGEWVDRCVIAPDRRSYAGHNRQGVGVSGTRLVEAGR